MTINPTLAEDQVTKELFPLPRPGEVFILKRQNIFFESGSRRAICKAMGLFMLSSQRFVFVAQKDKNKADFGSFEIPLEGILKQEFQQPIFGCNYLELQVTSGDPQVTGDTNFPVYLYFYEGGAGTFLTVFFKFFVEVQRRRGASGTDNALAQVAVQLVNNRHAYVDQSDPSTFYLQQPNAGGGPGEANHPEPRGLEMRDMAGTETSAGTGRHGATGERDEGEGPAAETRPDGAPTTSTAASAYDTSRFPGRGQTLGDT